MTPPRKCHDTIIWYIHRVTCMRNKSCYQAVILCIAVDHCILESNLITFNGFATSQLYSARGIVVPVITKRCGMACIVNALKASKKMLRLIIFFFFLPNLIMFNDIQDAAP